MKKGEIYKCNTKDFYVKVICMTDYIQNVNEPNGSCPQYILTQRLTIDFCHDKDYNPAHWNIEYFNENFHLTEFEKFKSL